MKKRVPGSLTDGRIVIVRRPGNDPSAGLLRYRNSVYPCLLGRSGITTRKREGDGATPAGRFPLLFGYYRADRLRPPPASLPLYPIAPDDGWCDDPLHPNYNRPVTLPFSTSCETMMRQDALYDICLVMDHNFSQRIRNLGSAVFFHLSAGKPHTQGCIAVAPDDMKRLLASMRPGTLIDIRS